MHVTVAQLDGVCTMDALPLAAGVVVAAARSDPELRDVAQFRVVPGDAPPAEVVAALETPDILGLSLYIWNEQVSLEVARQARSGLPGCRVVAGGPSVPEGEAAAARFLKERPELDVLVRGEGERTFRELLRAVQRGSPLDGVAGLAYRNDAGRVVVTPPRTRERDFDGLGSPFLDGSFDRLRRRWPHLVGGPRAVGVVETSRGCPFHCAFCTAGAETRDRVHELPLARVDAELRWIAENRFPCLFLADANFGIRPRDLGIAQLVAKLKARTGYPLSVLLYVPKNARRRHLAVVETLAEAGIGCRVALPTQSFDAEELATVQRVNVPDERRRRLHERCDARGLPTYNELILGLPGQRYATFTASVARAVSSERRDELFLYLCRAIPNSPLVEPAYRRRHGLQTRRCVSPPADPYRVAHVEEREEVVVGSSTLSTAEWGRAFRFGFLATALANHRLLDLVLRFLCGTFGADVRRYLERLCDALATAPPGTALSAVGDVLETFTSSILSGGALLLPAAGAGPVCREASDGVVAAVLRRPDAFFAEAAALTSEFLSRRSLPEEPIAELFRYQRFRTPTRGVSEPIEATFTRDWSACERPGRATLEALELRPTRLRFVPPPYAAAGRFRDFVDSHLATLRAGLLPGLVTPNAGGPAT